MTKQKRQYIWEHLTNLATSNICFDIALSADRFCTFWDLKTIKNGVSRLKGASGELYAELGPHVFRLPCYTTPVHLVNITVITTLLRALIARLFTAVGDTVCT